MKVENVLDFLLDNDNSDNEADHDESPFDNSDSNDTNDSILKENIHTKTLSNITNSSSFLAKQKSFASQPFKNLTNSNASFQKQPVVKPKKKISSSSDDSRDSSDDAQNGKYLANLICLILQK